MAEERVGARPWRLMGRRRLPDHPTAAEREAIDPVTYDVDSESLPDTDFDELVVGQWFHVEWMDADRWWMRIGEVVVWVTVDPSGLARDVEVYLPPGPDPHIHQGRPDLAWHNPDVNPPGR